MLVSSLRLRFTAVLYHCLQVLSMKVGSDAATFKLRVAEQKTLAGLLCMELPHGECPC